MTKAAAFSSVLLMMVMGNLFCPSYTSPQSEDCRNAVGRWEFSVSGRDCKGYEEEGSFIMTIAADCALGVTIHSNIPYNIPYLGEFLVTQRSLSVKNDRFTATVDFTVDECSTLELNGRIIDGKRIEGTYRYRDKGGGTFKAVKLNK